MTESELKTNSEAKADASPQLKPLLCGVIEKMDGNCDETWDFMKMTRADGYDLESEREEEIFMYGFINAMDYFREMLEEIAT